MWTARGTVAAAPVRANVITYETAPAGDINNPIDTTEYGSVAYEYRIGKYDDTIGYYTAFLNGVAKTDTYSRYNASMRKTGIAGR
jgi:hypothetical protein